MTTALARVTIRRIDVSTQHVRTVTPEYFYWSAMNCHTTYIYKYMV